MKMTAKESGAKLIISLSGELDHHGAKLVQRQIEEKLETGLPRDCVIDMSELTFMDSSGIGLVMGRYKLLKTHGGRLRVKGVNRSTMKVMKLAGLDLLAKIDCKE